MAAQAFETLVPPATDEALAARSRAGDERAIEALMRRHNRALYRAARAILRDDAEAEDVVQEAWLRAFAALGAFRGESSLRTWLIRIAANEALMRRRKRLQEARVVSVELDGGEAGVEQVADEAMGPEGAASGAEVRAALERHIDALPGLYREVFVLRAVEEMTVEETAQALGVPDGTVRVRFFRARAMLRGALERDIDSALASAFGFAGARCDRICARVIAALRAGHRIPLRHGVGVEGRDVR